MSAIQLHLREPLPFHVDLTGLRPDRLADQAPEDIATMGLTLGNRSVAVGDLFEVTPGSGEGPRLEIHNADGRLDGIGAGMEAGEVEVIGDAGHFLGRELRGGRIRVRGSCGDLAGAGMEDGRIVVEGDAGDHTGAALAGERRGMRGGSIAIQGAAGARTGERMRRGLLTVSGGAGEGTGARMVAGTIAVLGDTGPGTGFGMRRGTLLLDRRPQLPATFNGNGEHELGFLTLVRSELEELAPNVATAFPDHQRVERWVGDVSVGGLGEVLVWQ